MNRKQFLAMAGLGIVSPPVHWAPVTEDPKKPAKLWIGNRLFDMMLTDEEMDWLNKYFEDTNDSPSS